MHAETVERAVPEPQSDYRVLEVETPPLSTPSPSLEATAPRATTTLRGKGRLYWLTALWSLLWQCVMIAGAIFARSPYHAIALPLSVLWPRSAALGGGVRSARLPGRWVVAVLLVACAARLLACAVLSIVVNSDSSLNLTENGLLVPNIFGVFDARSQTKRFLVVVAVDAATLTLAGLYLRAMVGWATPDAQGALEHAALPRTSLQWVLAASTGIAAFSMPALRSLPLLVGHLTVVCSIALRAEATVKWKVLHGTAQVLAVVASLLLLLDLGWQNSGLKQVETGFEGLRFVEWTQDEGTSIRLLTLIVRSVSLCVTVWASRRLHGGWGRLPHVQAVAIVQALAITPSKRVRAERRRTTLRQVRRWASQTFPLLLVPLMVFVVTIVDNVASFIVVLAACLGLVATVDTFVRSLPALFILVSIVIAASYLAAVLNTVAVAFVYGTGQETTERVADQTWQFVQLGIVTVVAALWIVAFKLRRTNSSLNTHMLSRREKRKRLEHALMKVASELPAIELGFARRCAPGATVLKRSAVHDILHELTGERPNTADVDQTWDCFTQGDRLRARAVSTVRNLQHALSDWDQPRPDVPSDSEDEDDAAIPSAQFNSNGAHGSVVLLPMPSGTMTMETETVLVEGAEIRRAFLNTDKGRVQCNSPHEAAEVLGAMRGGWLTLAELILLHEDSQSATPDKDKELTKSHRRSIASLGLELGSTRNTGAIFTAFPGVPNKSFDGTEGALRDSFVSIDATGHHIGLHFSDLIVMHATVVTHKMHNHSWPFAAMRLAGQLILRNTTALTLLFMFAAATYGSTFDVMRMGLIALFVVFLCSATLRRKYWLVIIGYTVAIITILYAFKVIYKRQSDAPTTIGVASAEVLGLRVVNVLELWITFALLALSVMELRIFAALQNDVSFSRVLLEIEWRRFDNIPGAVALQSRLSLVVAAACFVIVGLVEPNSGLVAGFLIIFGLVIVVGRRVPAARNFLWILSTAYSIVALTAVSLFQFGAVDQWVQGQIDGQQCRAASKTARQCATDLGLNRAGDRPLVQVLLPWFIACTANVVQLSMRLKADERATIGAIKFDPYYTSQPLQLLFRFMAFSALAGTAVRRFLGVHGPKVAWVGLIFAAVSTVRLSAAPYAILLLLDQRGPIVVVVSILHMAATYVYPLFFIPAIPKYDQAWAEYVGIAKTVHEGDLAAPVTAFACAMVYVATVSQHRRATTNIEVDSALRRLTSQRERKVKFVSASHSAGSTFSGGKYDLVEMTALDSPLLSSEANSPASPQSPNNVTITDTESPRCRFCTTPGCRGACDVGCELPEGRKLTLPERCWQFITALRLSGFDTVGYEIICLVILIAMVLTCRRITAVVFFVCCVVMWVAGRFHTTARVFVPTALMLVSGLLFVWLMFVRIGLPPDAQLSGPFATPCTPWWAYLGCAVPKQDIALSAVVMTLFRICRVRAHKRLLAWHYAGAFKTLGGYLRANRASVDALLSFQRSDIDNVLLAPPPRDFLGDPHRFDEVVISYFIALFPVSVGAFFHGALTVNVVSVMEMLLGLFLIVYARSIYWKFPRYWPPVCLFFLLTLVVQLVANLPPVLEWARAEVGIAKSLGVTSWAEANRSSTFATVVQIAVVWMAFVQNRVFNEPFFNLKLRSLYQGSVVAIRRHYEVLDYMNRRAEAQAEAVRTKEERLNEKLDAIRASRRTKIHITVGGNPEDEEPLSLRNTSFGGMPLSPAGRGVSSDQIRRALAVLGQEDVPVRSPTPTATPTMPAVQVTKDPLPTETEAEADKTTKERLLALRAWAEEYVDAAIVWMTEQSYRGHAPPPHLPRVQRLALAAWNFSLRRTMEMCLVIVTANFVTSGTLLDMSFCLIAVVYAMVLLPWPSERFWDGIMAANAFGIFVKSALRIVAENVVLSRRMEDFLAITFIDLGRNGRQDRTQAAFVDLVMDFAVFGAILLHKQVCTDSGVYASRYATSEEAISAAARTVTDASVAVLPLRSSPNEAQQPQVDAVGFEKADDTKSCDTTTRPDGDKPHEVPARPDSADRIDESHTHLLLDTSVGSRPDDCPAYKQDAEADAAQAAAGLEPAGADESVTDAAGRIMRTWLGSAKSAGQRVGDHARYVFGNVQERQGVGLDLYTLYLAVDLISLVYVAAAYYGLVGRATGSFIDSVQQDLLPGPLVLFLLLIVCIMVADRVVYITGSLRAKFALHVTLAAAYHATYVYWRYSIAGASTMVGTGLFLIKMIYLVISCAQIRIGFALHRRHDPFTVGVGTLHWLGNFIYRSIPFLYEMRVLLDWTCARTSLKLNSWLTIEDVHRELYDRFYDIMHSQWTNPRRGTKYPWGVKAYTGVLGFVLILVVLFFPLMYYSTFNPNLQPNYVSSLSLDLAFGPFSQFYTASAYTPDQPSDLAHAIAVTRPSMERLGITEEFKTTQLLELTPCSSRVWGVSPQSRKFILDAINRSLVNGTDFVIGSTIQLSRQGATSGSTKDVTLRNVIVLPTSVLMQLYNAIALSDVYNVSDSGDDSGDANSSSTGAGTVRTIPLGPLYDPFVWNKPSSVYTLDVQQTLRGNMADCVLQLSSNTSTGDEYLGSGAYALETWCVKCNPLFRGGNTLGDPARYPSTGCVQGWAPCIPADNLETNPITNDFVSGPFVVVVSDPVPQDSNFLPNVGIIALYTTFILTLWTILRGSVTGYAHKIVMQQIARPQPVAELISYIYLVRSVGDPKDDLELEELLYFELLDLIRGPDTMLAKTGRRVDDYDDEGNFAPTYDINL
jgi:hypothetical protein